VFGLSVERNFLRINPCAPNEFAFGEFTFSLFRKRFTLFGRGEKGSDGPVGL